MIAAAVAAAAAGQSLSCPKSFLGYRTPRRRRGSRNFTCAAAAAPNARVRNSNSDSGSDSSSSSSPSSNPATLYDVLGVPAFAAARDIKAAYRRLARERHPDVAAAAAEQNGGGSAEEFIRIHAAYATLSDPNKRAEYDRDVMQQRAGGCRQVCSYGGPSQAPTPGRMPRRSWETDQCW
uniref:J domain-containing protein n=1 Tax=Ananas comosus var. bracteatus TaxID=296719 RepID=A0A6V7PHW5_ANACO|nr:unnamed protein product [Ananas comosus var. bracteatus]